MAATGRTLRRRRRGHCRAPGGKPLEIGRDGGGKAPYFALSLTLHQYELIVRALLELHSHSAMIPSSEEASQEAGDVPGQGKGRCAVGATCGTSHPRVCQGAIHPWGDPVSPCGPVGPWAASHQEKLVAQALVLGEASYCSQQLCRSWL